MHAKSQVATNVTLIRAPRPRETENPLPYMFRDQTNRLIDKWHAPKLSEREIDIWATRFLLCPKTGMSFVEYLIVHGVGTLA
jgi:hypothetical protein